MSRRQGGRSKRGTEGVRRAASLLPAGAQRGAQASSRPAQVAEVVRQVVSTMLLEGALKDPRLSGSLITVTDVEMSRDLRSGKIFFSVFPEDEQQAARVLRGFRSAGAEVRRTVGAALGLRNTPELDFRLDGSAAYGERIERVLKEIKDSDDDGPGDGG